MSAKPVSKKKVLFVDDEPAFLEMIENLFGMWCKGEWEIHIATNTGKALSLIQEHPIDLVVVDVRMPVVDGIQFMQLLHRKYPALPKVALTGVAEEEKRAAALAAGAELFLEKPANIEGMEQVFNTLNELIKIHPQEGFRGVMRRVGLQEVLQLECLGAKSSILEITAGQMRGKIFIQDGRIVHAQMGRVAGVAAFNRILTLQGGEFNLRPFTEPPEQTIQDSWESLLMEAARLMDEKPESEYSETAFLSHAEAEPRAAAPTPRAAASPAPASARPAAPILLQPRVDELLVCSPKGDVLYEWQCAAAEPRIELIRFVSQHAQSLAQKLPVGNFRAFENQMPQSRQIIKQTADGPVLVRTSNNG